MNTEIKILYLPMIFMAWKNISVENNKIEFDYLNSMGFIPIYTSVEELKKDYPDTEVTEVKVIKLKVNA